MASADVNFNVKANVFINQRGHTKCNRYLIVYQEFSLLIVDLNLELNLKTESGV